MTTLPIAPPDSIRLSECTRDLEAIFECMALTEKDRSTRAYHGWLSISPPTTEWHDQIRYAEQCYLVDAARQSIARALRSGQLPVATDHEVHISVPLNGSILFVVNKCKMNDIVLSGIYQAMNLRDDFGDDRRRACDGAVLWVAEMDWTRIRLELVREHSRAFGSELALGLSQLLPPVEPPFEPTPMPSAPWSSTEMLAAIRACPISNREQAWAEHFKPRLAEHGWSNDAWRRLWSEGRGTKGMKGRPAASIR